MRKLILAGLLASLLAGCVPDKQRAEQRLRESGELTVLTRLAPNTYFYESENGPPDGFEYALTQELAREVGVPVRYELFDSVPELLAAAERGEGDIVIPRLSRRKGEEARFIHGPDYLLVRQEVVCRRGQPMPRDVAALTTRSILVLDGGSAEDSLNRLKADHPELNWFVTRDLSHDQILEKVWDGTVDCTVADSNVVALLRPHYPELRVAFRLPGQQRLAWILRPGDLDLLAYLHDWFSDLERDRRLPSLRDRYFGGNPPFDYVDIKVFRARIDTRLPRYRDVFIEAGEASGIDWMLLAAQAYQESHWNYRAKSPTGVRGIMMLTQPTAKEVGVTDRLDPAQSITGGARYLAKILEAIPAEIEPEDRVWFALAAYNVGLGHVEDARVLTRRQRRDPDRWNDVQQFLPYLSRPEYYRELDNGFARGSEPVHYVRRIRSYHSILVKRLRG